MNSSVSMKDKEFLDWPNDYQLVGRAYLVPWGYEEFSGN
jgi:hypothetical protein